MDYSLHVLKLTWVRPIRHTMHGLAASLDTSPKSENLDGCRGRSLPGLDSTLS